MHVAPETGFQVDIALIRQETPDQQQAQVRFRDQDLGDWHHGQAEAWGNPDKLASHVVVAVEEQITRLEAREQHGFTRDGYAVGKMDRRDQIRALLEEGDEERDLLLRQKAELERKLSNLDESYQKALGIISYLSSDLEKFSSHLPADIRDAASTSLRDGNFDAADDILGRITEDFETRSDAAEKRVAVAYFRRGEIAEEQVRWTEAASFYQRAAQLDPTYDHLLKAREFQWRIGNLDLAYNLSGDLVEAAREGFGEDTKEFAIALNERGHTLRQMGQNDEAERIYREAIDWTRRKVGTQHQHYAIALNNLAVLLRHTGRQTEAEPLLRSVIDIDVATIGEDHPDHATPLNNLATTLMDLDQLDEAEALLRRAVEIDATALGESHPVYANHIGNLAKVIGRAGKVDEAKRLFRKAMDIDAETIGVDHPNHATRRRGLADVESTMGDSAAAEEHL